MAYQELIKNFESIRDYMREFYVYGFKSRMEYDKKSARAYDDKKRQIESWLGDYMCFSQNADGKNVFLSVDSRKITKNPLYKAWKAKSFTKTDITLHFAIFDILYSDKDCYSLKELIEKIDIKIGAKLVFDEKTLRLKLSEYEKEGLIIVEKKGRTPYYRRADDSCLPRFYDCLNFFSETLPAGVVGSFILDKSDAYTSSFLYKHHYITQTMDSEVLVAILDAMHQKRRITFSNFSKHAKEAKVVCVIPLKIFISVQNGRQNLLAFDEEKQFLMSYRLDYIAKVTLSEPVLNYEAYRKHFTELQKYMWGVNGRWDHQNLEHVEFDLFVSQNEEFIISRLEREKRCGTVIRLDETHVRFCADVFDTLEMLPWMRTFISRIVRLNLSNKKVEETFLEDLNTLYDMYEISEVTGNDSIS